MTDFKVPHFNPHSMRGLILFIVIIALVAGFSQMINFVTDWLWFQEVGYQNVFFTTLFAQLKTALLFGTGFLIIFYTNLFLAIRLSSRIFVIERDDTIRMPSWDINNQSLHIFALSVSLFLALSAALLFIFGLLLVFLILALSATVVVFLHR